MKKRSKFLIFFILFFLIIIPIFFLIVSNKQNNKIEEKIVNYVISTIPVEDIKTENKLDVIVKTDFGKTTDYAVVIKNFKTGEEVLFNEDMQFNSASLYKLWVFAVAMQQIKNGDINPDEVISGDKNKYDEILGIITPEPTSEDSTEEGEQQEAVYISMSISNAIEKMITESDNYAALLLTQKVGYKNVDKFLIDYGLNDSSFGSPPKTTAGDIASYYEMLYKGEIIDKTISSEMIDILKRQTLNDRIPKYIPEDVVVAHKTGELFGAKHDAGIVYSKNGDYIIIVLSQTDNEAIAAEKIAKFSEDIYNYFSIEN